MMNTVAPFTPIQYVTGRAGFCGMDFAVSEGVFIPRPETEVLVGSALEAVSRLSDRRRRIRILDLCTGSGCVAVAMAVSLGSSSGRACVRGGVQRLTKGMMECKIIASDISHVALDTAAANARSHGVWDAIEFVESDLFKRVKGRFDLITANPPYIAGSEFAHLQEEVLMEPRNAIDGGADGLDFYRRIAREARGALKKDGCMVLEIGFGQAAAVRDILEQAGGLRVTEVRKDFNGIDRVITCARV